MTTDHASTTDRKNQVMGLFDRVSRLVRSNVNSAISSAEDPEKILDQTILDMQMTAMHLKANNKPSCQGKEMTTCTTRRIRIL